MKRMILAAMVAPTMLAVTLAVAPSAQAGGDEIFFVKTVTQSALIESDYDTREFACNWWRYDRAEMYRESWAEVWAGEGVTYRDMRIGIYRAMKNVCW